MKKSSLKDVFKVVAAKYLSVVDANPNRSNQHEFGGLSALKTLWGETEDRIFAQFIYFDSHSEEPLSEDGFITWYDARSKNPDRHPEWRIYYQSNSVTKKMKEGDLLIVSEIASGKAIVAIAEKDSTYAAQLLNLFGIQEIQARGFTVVDLDSGEELSLASRYILDTIGIQYEFSDENYLDKIIYEFGNEFPNCTSFSSFAQNTFPSDFATSETDDEVIIQWLEREELLFRTLENHLVSCKIKEGFSDVESFIKYSLSVLNRRKSRAGKSFENHLEALFKIRKIRYSREAITENRVRPDFLFPSIEAYNDGSFDASLLTMLGVKTTCKDRWRQVLSEAARISNKHLITMEPAISHHQLDEMRTSFLQLIVPEKIKPTYSSEDQKWIWNIQTFISYIKDKENRLSQ